MSIFNLDTQNSNIDFKIVSGLERLSQVFRILLWEKAKESGLSPIQIQILIFLKYHSADKATITYIAKEFNLTKATISDAVSVMEKNKLVKKINDPVDMRSYCIQLMAAGRKIATDADNFTSPVAEIIGSINKGSKPILWQNIVTLITQLNKSGIISVQRTCYNCKHFSSKTKTPYCNLLKQQLEIHNIRIDCAEFEIA